VSRGCQWQTGHPQACRSRLTYANMGR
jgi:hypothetical protein